MLNKCGIGAKLSRKGALCHWTGCKLHLDTAKGGIPVSAIITSASTHGSQAAIPLIQMSRSRLAYLYEAADSAYDANQTRNFSSSLGHAPIIGRNKRSEGSAPIKPGYEAIFKSARSASERANSDLKDNCGATAVSSARVRQSRRQSQERRADWAELYPKLPKKPPMLHFCHGGKARPPFFRQNRHCWMGQAVFRLTFARGSV